MISVGVLWSSEGSGPWLHVSVVRFCSPAADDLELRLTRLSFSEGVYKYRLVVWITRKQ
jgi:hypothetical protein